MGSTGQPERRDYESYLNDEYRTFTPAVGENCVRILPPSPIWEASSPRACRDDLEHGAHAHGIGPERGSVVCLFHMRRQACPICEERARAERAKDEETTKDLRAVKRVLTFIINRKDEAQGPLVWAMPYTVDRDIAKACKDRSTGEHYFIDRPDDGYDVYFDRDGQQMLTKYTGVALAKRPSPVAPKIVEWLETHSQHEARHWRDYVEVKRLYEEWAAVGSR
jgi:hypothetical protein